MPAQAGRRITGGLSILNRAGRGAFSRVWLPKNVTRSEAPGHNFQAEWVAIREIDIARQYGNHMIYDMDMQSSNQWKWIHYDHSRMSDDGYRFLVITMGVYEKPATHGDELQIFDQTLRERVQQIANMMWDIERGNMLSDALSRQLWFKGLNDQRIALDIGLNIAGLDLLYHAKNWKTQTPTRRLNYDLTKKFMDVVGTLRGDRFHSDQVMFGIDVPEFHKSNQWIYLADSEHKIWEFNKVIATTFSKFDICSTCGYGQQPTVMHLPTYRNRQRVQRQAG